MVKIAIGLLVLCTLLGVAALASLGLIWIGLLLLGAAVATLLAAYLLDQLEDGPRRGRLDSRIHADSRSNTAATFRETADGALLIGDATEVTTGHRA